MSTHSFAESFADRMKILDKRTCITDQLAVDEMYALKEELKNREAAVAKREIELTQKEEALKLQISSLDQKVKEILAGKQSVKASNQEKVARLVETIENMSPKPAAQMMAEIETNLAVEVLSQLSALKRAKILSLLSVQKSTELSEGLAGIARAKEGDTRRKDSDESAAIK